MPPGKFGGFYSPGSRRAFLVKETMRAKVWHGKCTLCSQRRILEYHFWKSRLDYTGGSIARDGSGPSTSFETKIELSVNSNLWS